MNKYKLSNWFYSIRLFFIPVTDCCCCRVRLEADAETDPDELDVVTLELAILEEEDDKDDDEPKKNCVLAFRLDRNLRVSSM